jgi:tetratricopeptide (TPR) repeat protein
MARLLLLLFFCTTVLSCQDSSSKKEKKDSLSRPTAIGCGTPTTDKAWYAAGTKAPLLEGLGGVDFKITTSNKEAQAYFNQGLMLSYGFNHAEAARSFFEAIRLDSTCAMAYWGFAFVLGPNYNAGMEDDNYERAYAAIQKAVALSDNCSAKEKALILALSNRYTATAPEDRSGLDIAFSKAMKKVYEAYPNDPDISAIYAESIMDLHPWDLYDKKTKAPRPWTGEIVQILEKLMKQFPRHPGAPHFYIHAVEASDSPERGLAAAHLLMTLVPGSGHLVHMPSHIYIWTGDYHLGSLANLAAVKSDSAYVTACHAQGAYPLAYYPHNYHYLSATASFEGNSKLAWEAAQKVQEKTAKDVMQQPGWGTLQHYYTVPYFVAVKFGLWDSILAVKNPDMDLVYPRAILHYARGMAFLGKNETGNAAKELSQLRELAKDSTLPGLTIWDINTMSDIVQIAVHVLTAETYLHQKEFEQAIGEFEKAIVIEDNLNYNEPPDWFFSVRHHLGLPLLKAGQYKKAEKVYREDLGIWKENGWALRGLVEALEKQGRSSEAQQVYTRFKEAWRYADFDLNELMRL